MRPKLTPDTSVRDACLPLRALKAAHRAIGGRFRDQELTLRHLAELTARELRAQRNFGQTTLMDLKAILAEAGLQLADDCTPRGKVPRGVNSELFWLAEQLGLETPHACSSNQELAWAIKNHENKK